MSTIYYINALHKLGYFKGQAAPNEWNSSCVSALYDFSIDYSLPTIELNILEEPHISKIGEIYKIYPEGVFMNVENPKVFNLQKKLKQIGKVLSVDGHHGPETRRVLNEFQEEHNILKTAYFDKPTINKINELAKVNDNLHSLINYLVDKGKLGSEFRNCNVLNESVSIAIGDALLNDELGVFIPQRNKLDSDLSKAEKEIELSSEIYYELPEEVLLQRNSSKSSVKNKQMELSNKAEYALQCTKGTYYQTPYVSNLFGLACPIKKVETDYLLGGYFDVSHNTLERPSRSEYAWRMRGSGNRIYANITWHNGVDITTNNNHHEAFAVDECITINRGGLNLGDVSPHESHKEIIGSVDTIFLDQEKYGCSELPHKDGKPYSEVKNLSVSERKAWAERLDINAIENSYRNANTNGTLSNDFAYSVYSHVVFPINSIGQVNNKYRPAKGTFYEKGQSMGLILSNTGMGDLYMQGKSYHLHFELHIPGDPTMLCTTNNSAARLYIGGMGSVDPRRYIDFSHLDSWGFTGPYITDLTSN